MPHATRPADHLVTRHSARSTAGEQRLLDLLATAQRRESELEALYVDGEATEDQLAELEQVRGVIDDSLEALGDLGYFNPS